jgi:hypothetical protein
MMTVMIAAFPARVITALLLLMTGTKMTMMVQATTVKQMRAMIGIP